MKTEYDVIVVGGGPAGSMAAWEVAKAGVSVCMLEKDRDIGYPVRCGEAIGDFGLRQFVEPKPNWIASTITGTTLVSPNGTSVSINFSTQTGYILHRRIFDYDLSRYASNAGADIYTKAYVDGLIKENNKICGISLTHLGKKKQIRGKIIIGADGLTSRIGRWGGIRTQIRMKDMESCVQYSVSNIDVDQDKMIMYVGDNHAPGGYLWIFPKGDRSANIGIGISGKYSKEKSAQKYLDDFMKKEYPDAAILTTMCGGVPCAKPMREPVEDNLMLIGDAAHQVNPMTGGGIVSGMKGGWIAGQVAADCIHKGNTSKKALMKYSEWMRKDFGKNHERFYRIKEAVSQLQDSDLDSIAYKVSNISEKDRTLMSVFKAAVFKKPSLVVDVVRVFAGI